MPDDLQTKVPFSGLSSNNLENDSVQISVNYKVLTSENNAQDSEQILDKDKIIQSEYNMDYFEPMDLSTAPVENKISCELCNLTFSSNSNLRRHEKRIHSLDNTLYTKICALCNIKKRTMLDLHKHMEVEHPEIEIVFQDKIFYCPSDFDQWKTEIERQTVSSFILSCSRIDGNSELQYYKCHRSGVTKPSKNLTGKRRSKFAGSIKAGVTCPAMIRVIKETFYEATQITVRYQLTHVGHECEVEKLSLQKDERLMLADMLSSGMSVGDLMNRIQSEFSPTTRLGVITRQDIYNVIRDFNLDVDRENERAVHKMMPEKYSSVLVIDTREKYISENGEKEILQKRRNTPRMYLDNKKLAIEKLLKSISSEVQSLECFKDLCCVEKNLKNIVEYIEGIEKPELLISKVLPKKKACRQRKYQKNE
ncbi:uncharacterized protein [Parasteatoda tepidariorum]|uniref:uncharacterized protein n=1 Tax=Parasteatoda tepidariorum TaxID=114398 RepID=UPI00077FA8D0|nr:uncharacterized protein LOC107442568 [Parasteatoda tepidariorum]